MARRRWRSWRGCIFTISKTHSSFFPAEILGMLGTCNGVVRRCDWRLIGSLRALGFSPMCFAGQETPRAVETVRREPGWQTVDAADATRCRIEGKHAIQVYPRSVGRHSVFLSEGSRLTVSTKARA